MDIYQTERDYVIKEFDRALANQEIKVYYQPVVRSINCELCGMEALARWDSPELGMLVPSKFITALEESGQIYKLDLYVIHEVCRTMRERLDRKQTVVPVSFNLSRMDFISCDIFTEVEAALRDYELDRDMLRIEITESMMAKDPSLIDEATDKFQRAGYQIWMDDFGSGYSSLNLLKDHFYDEIKIDMGFLSNFTERSKEILTSIVDMAKRIGIQTLAEGVETEEQFLFLRDIGCEKLQGFYFGEPKSIEESMLHCAKMGYELESRMWHNYYDAIGRVNFITDRPMGLVEYDGEEIHFLYINKYYLEILRNSGSQGMDDVNRNLNSPGSPLYQKFRTLHKNFTGETESQEVDYSIRGAYFRLKVRRIAGQNEKFIYHVEIQHLAQQKMSEEMEQIDETFRMMYLMYDTIYRINLEQDRIEPLMRNAFYEEKNLKRIAEYSAEEAMLLIMRESIYPADQKHFLEWSDMKTVEGRIAEREDGYLAEYFRTKEENGAYVWKVHRILLLPGLQQRELVYSVMKTPLNQDETLKNIAFSVGRGGGLEDNSAMLWRGLMDSNTSYIFWKDKDRRFVGANRHFLDFYGIEDEKELLGKTDEDMHWHVDNEPFRSDEYRVLRNGETLINRVGKCIVRGALHTIMATKTPMYQNGKIVGLLGYFIDVDDFTKDGEGMDSLARTDALTGLMNTTGMLCTLSDYVEQLDSFGHKFALIRLTVPQYRRTVESYGRKTANQLLKRIGDLIRREIGGEACCARIHSGDFQVCIQYEDGILVEFLVKRLRDTISDIHSINGYAVTVSPEIKAVYADELRNFPDLIMMINAAEQRI